MGKKLFITNEKNSFKKTISIDGDKSISMNRASGDAANGFRFHYTADAEL